MIRSSFGIMPHKYAKAKLFKCANCGKFFYSKNLGGDSPPIIMPISMSYYMKLIKDKINKKDREIVEDENLNVEVENKESSFLFTEKCPICKTGKLIKIW